MQFETRTGTSEHGVCSFCGADKVKSPRTQKIFCSEKCFAKTSPDAQNGGAQQPRQQSNTNIPLDQFITKAELNITLDRMRSAFTNMQEQIKDLSSRLEVAEQALDEIVSQQIPIIKTPLSESDQRMANALGIK